MRLGERRVMAPQRFMHSVGIVKYVNELVERMRDMVVRLLVALGALDLEQSKVALLGELRERRLAEHLADELLVPEQAALCEPLVVREIFTSGRSTNANAPAPPRPCAKGVDVAARPGRHRPGDFSRAVGSGVDLHARRRDPRGRSRPRRQRERRS